MKNGKQKTNISAHPWMVTDEHPHPDSMIEWWCAQALLNNPDFSEPLSFKATLTQWNEPTGRGSIFHQTLHNQYSDFKSFYKRDNSNQLIMKKKPIHISYNQNSIAGRYPDYTMSFHDMKHNLHLDLKYHAEVSPHWVAQESTNGWLPMGFGRYRYGFIPRLTVTGKLTKNKKTYQLNGTGYYEHVWGDFSYDKPIASIQDFTKTAGTYAQLFYWWMKQYHPKIPKKITMCTENNPFGYDWVWAKLDNDWTLFFGNILFWLMNGPVAGILIINKENGEYEEWGNISFQYHCTRKSNHFDFEYPSDFEISARRDDTLIHFRFQMTGNTHEYIARFPHKGFYIGFVICEAPGTVTGYVEKNGKKKKISGVCKIEPQRQISRLGHNKLIVQAKSVGIKTTLTSHFLNKEIKCSCDLLPRPRFTFHHKRIQKQCQNCK